MYNLNKYSFENGILDISFYINIDKLEYEEDFFKNLSAEEKESIYALIYFLNEAGLIAGVNK
mgnify:CR=1 FL=1|jgi:hypothetical protein